MNDNKKDISNQQNEGMSKEKTNQDYNKQKPDKNDPNHNKNHQIGEKEEEINQEKGNTAEKGNIPYNHKQG